MYSYPLTSNSVSGIYPEKLEDLFKKKKLLEGITSGLKEEIQNASLLPSMGKGLCVEHKPFKLRKDI